MLGLFFSLGSKEDKKQVMNSEPLSSAIFRNLLYLTRFLNRVRKMNHNVEVMSLCLCVHPCAFHLKLLDSF